MCSNIVDKLVQLGIATKVDGYSESEKALIMFESKYNMTSKAFYENYYNDEVPDSISVTDKEDWLFNCECYISCDGSLENLENSQNFQLSIEFNPIKNYYDCDFEYNSDIKKEENNISSFLCLDHCFTFSILSAPIKVYITPDEF